jgi:predicted CXXCH cytochrome family protein
VYVRTALLIVSFAGVVHPLSGASSSQKVEPSRSYVGTDVCRGCHDELYEPVASSPHGALFKEGGRGCESCHGPGSAHVDGAGDKSKIFYFRDASPELVREHCLACHTQDPQPKHNQGKMTCLSCHSVHHYQSKAGLLVEPATRLCRKCH